MTEQVGVGRPDGGLCRSRTVLWKIFRNGIMLGRRLAADRVGIVRSRAGVVAVSDAMVQAALGESRVVRVD